MTIQSQVNAFEDQFEEMKQQFPSVTQVWFTIKEISYADFIAYCDENNKSYEVDKADRLRAIAKSDVDDITIWLYTKKLKIKKHIHVEELEAVTNHGV